MSHLVVLPLRSVNEVLLLVVFRNRALVVEDEVNLEVSKSVSVSG